MSEPDKNEAQRKVNFNGKMIAPLATIDGNSLRETYFEPLQFAIENIMPEGVFIIGGSGKIGKSWLSLDMCVAIATGGRLWDFNAAQGEVLYLALEDNFRRLKDRLITIENENVDISRLHLTTSSLGITDGLLDQINYFLDQYPGTRFIVIDTLEHIRNDCYDKNMYSCDYRDMTRLRAITDNRKLTLLLVHHTRKMFDPDPLNTLSGSTGLVGAVDGVFVLEKTKRTSDEAKLTIANRDTEGFCFKLKFDTEKCRWLLIDKNAAEEDAEENICVVIDDFLQEYWCGTATQLCNEIKKFDSGFTAATIAKELRSNADLFIEKYGIEVEFDRSNKKRLIMMTRLVSA